MKKIVLFILLMLPVAVMAQKDVTTFLGIPVDGTKDAMIHKLAQKGFKKAPYGKGYDMTGEFNGEKVELNIVTYKNKVWRIAVADKTIRPESDIRIRFNNLVDQFDTNNKYIPVNFGQQNFKIQFDENISYEMMVNNKRYQAAYYQIVDVSKIDTSEIQNSIKQALIKKYGESAVEKKETAVVTEAQKLAIEHYTDILDHKHVWFMINRQGYNNYSIFLYYDNEYNHFSNEDL